MNVLFGFINEYKKSITICAVCLICVLAAFYAGYLLGIRNVSNIGTGTDTIRNELNAVGAAVESAASGISQATSTAAKVSDGITAAQESADYIKRTADDSTTIIAECKQILAKVRARGKKEAP